MRVRVRFRFEPVRTPAGPDSKYPTKNIALWPKIVGQSRVRMGYKGVKFTRWVQVQTRAVLAEPRTELAFRFKDFLNLNAEPASGSGSVQGHPPRKHGLKYQFAYQQAQDQLNALLTMAQLKYDNFMGQVTQTGDNVKKAVSSAVTAFAKGDILDGVFAIVNAGVEAVLGNVAANQSQHRTYAITCGELGGIMRIDIDIFCYTFTYLDSAHGGDQQRYQHGVCHQLCRRS
ncbi:hypothetical protein FB45DRAFT_997151 [Roridomyces roridus]|uniref:Uncharacterized protein n=1 Tax=Roridomyces roridus TaxID=1738132 RepID=A0AAD7CKN9_9AGAR|nr:hypothetical protein FB45DRAFT_997151 [Roridomyces roridus]